MAGPDSIVPYLLVQVHNRRSRLGALGSLIVEQTLLQAYFMGADGEVRPVTPLRTMEFAALLDAARNAGVSERLKDVTWETIAQAADPRWGTMFLVADAAYTVPPEGDQHAIRRQLLADGLTADHTRHRGASPMTLSQIYDRLLERPVRRIDWRDGSQPLVALEGPIVVRDHDSDEPAEAWIEPTPEGLVLHFNAIAHAGAGLSACEEPLANILRVE